MDLKQNKTFERPVGGSYLGTIIDVVEMPKQKSTFNGVTKEVDKVRIVWVLGYTNNQPYNDKEGNPMRQAAFVTASMAAGKKPSNLYKIVTQVLNAAPPVISNSEDLAKLLIGRSNELFLTQEPDTQNPGSFFTNVAGIAPLKPGQVAPQIPKGFVRAKDKAKETAGPNPGQTTQTFPQQPVNLSSPQTAPATTNEAF